MILPRNRSREIGYDPKKQGEGEYCLYNSYGAASTVVEIDCLTGEHQVSCDVKRGEKNRQDEVLSQCVLCKMTRQLGGVKRQVRENVT